MSKDTPPQTATLRIAVACADDALRASAIARLEQAGASPASHADLTGLAAAAERCDAVLVFADEFGELSLVSCLDALERRRSGPMLVIVTDRSPPSWRPKLERERPTLVIPRAIWEANGVGLVLRTREAAVEAEYSGPELPFTD